MTTAVEPRERTVEARGLRFHYVEWGEPDAPVILMLHGLTSVCRIWDTVARAFQDRYRIIALDQRGHGESEWPAGADFATDDYVSDLAALVDGWGLERFDMIGLSMGGMNGIAYAARNPERAGHLVVIDIPPMIPHEKRPSLQLDKHIAEHGHPVLDNPDVALALIRLTNQTTSDDALRHRLSHQLKRLDDGKYVFKYDARVSYYWNPSDLWEELPKVQAPVLIVRGGKSQVLPESTAERMRAAFPNAELITVAEAGHTVPEDTPDQFIEAVEAFLAK